MYIIQEQDALIKILMETLKSVNKLSLIRIYLSVNKIL